MSAKTQIETEIRLAYAFLRERNTTIPSETLQFMLDASLEKLQGQKLPIAIVGETCGRCGNELYRGLYCIHLECSQL